MYAVIATGGKQYKVAQGDILRIEKLLDTEGEEVQFDKVLLISDGDNIEVGTPFIDGKAVSATVKAHGRGKKIEIVKFKRRKHHRKQMGHRQSYTEVEITGIAAAKAGKSAKPAAKAKAAPAADVTAAKPSLLTEPNGEADNLKLISGVGPVLEGKLNALGIFHFSQVAAFSTEEITWVDEQLSFKGRMVREDWVGQAKTLAEGGETEFSKRNK